MGVIFEPFKIKSVEPIPLTTREERLARIERAGFNPFQLPASAITFDLLTDSGTAAMSAEQWAAMLVADESYAGSRSFEKFEVAVRALTGLRHVIPTHQGRAAERILFSCAAKPGQRVPSNSHFDTTRANLEYLGVIADDLVIAEGRDPASRHPFKGNVDLDRLARYLDQHAGQVPFGMCTITNNSGGGQPVALENLQAQARLYRARGIPFFLDACRFAENAWFIREREPGQHGKSVEAIAQECFALADGCTMSGKKDALVNMGGLLALNDDTLAARCKQLLILTEGFPTYGGCAARDLEAFAVGLKEGVDERYLEYRAATTRYLAKGLNDVGIPTVQPPGGHAVFIDARAFLPHLPPEQLPGQSLVVELYVEGGVRACEIGSVMFGKKGADGRFEPAALELVRLAMPRRCYTQSHIDRVLEIAAEIARRKESLVGYEMVERPPFLPHFTARFRPLAATPAGALTSARSGAPAAGR
ncbi:MAG: tryptophanase [Planctomycetes bacterium]|nr:tryptophanase [Planctomycetota bacterium]